MINKEQTYAGYYVHDKTECEGEFCPFHNPSDHKLNEAPMYIRADKYMLVERICEHGIGHDDPDSVAYFERNGVKGFGVHGCDGCCGIDPFTEGEISDIVE